jgi:glucosamine-6-phosphate deaminase
MGIATILEARQVVLLTFGRNKAEAIAATVDGPVCANHPASILQMDPAAKLMLHSEAAVALRRQDYYRWVYDHKPEWQQC